VTLNEMKEQLKNLKAEAKSLLAENKVQEAENKTVEIKILNAKIEMQEKLDEAQNKITELDGQIKEKDDTISNLKAELDKANNEKSEIMNKFTEATNKIAELQGQVKEMTPIVEKYHEEQYNNKLNSAKESYKIKFEKCGLLDVFETEEIQNLIKDTINEDEAIATKAKFVLSEKLLNAIHIEDVSIDGVQELASDTKNLVPEASEFETIYGFEKE